ncbi:TRAP transporter small permease [Celeribacter indicus]|nr:TRAP transporter small permease [Celeribacter indicus]SDX28841.1 TRAP-type C4-dicarboxylate transport system, small permease component [Celeribacter indicus]
MRDFTSLIRAGETAMRLMAVFSGIALAALMIVQTAMRYFLTSPFLGFEELAVLAGLWLYALGAAFATRLDAHVRGGFLNSLDPGDGRLRILRAGASLVCAAVCGVYAWTSVAYTLRQAQIGRVSPYLGWPRWLWTASFALAFSVMVLWFLVEALRRVQGRTADPAGAE